MVHQTLDGATAVARSRRQKACQDPQCMQKSKRHKSKSRKSKANKPHKSAPSSPVGTPKKAFLTNPVTPSVTFNKPKKHELDLDPQWISAFPPVETPSEAGFPVMSGKLTGCCGRNLTHKPLSNSYSALDSTGSEDGGSHYEPKMILPNKKPVSKILHFIVSYYRPNIFSKHTLIV